MDYVNCYYNGLGSFRADGCDYEKALNKSFSFVLPFIMKQKLTERQYLCIKYRYESEMSQRDIAEKLKVSQSTVSRHIISAKKILNSELKYCYAAVTAALGEYERLGQSCV